MHDLHDLARWLFFKVVASLVASVVILGSLAVSRSATMPVSPVDAKTITSPPLKTTPRPVKLRGTNEKGFGETLRAIGVDRGAEYESEGQLL